MSSTYGESLRLSIFGQSHGPAIGMTLDGIPAGLPVDLEKLQSFLARRAPGQNDWSTPRKEGDCPEFLAGILDGRTCGAPIAVGVVVYVIAVIKLKAITREDCLLLPKGEKIAKFLHL